LGGDTTVIASEATRSRERRAPNDSWIAASPKPV
jgi:hypothetical protein